MCPAWIAESAVGLKRPGVKSGFAIHQAIAWSAEFALALAVGDVSLANVGGGGSREVSGIAIHGSYGGGAGSSFASSRRDDGGGPGGGKYSSSAVRVSRPTCCASLAFSFPFLCHDFIARQLLCVPVSIAKRGHTATYLTGISGFQHLGRLKGYMSSTTFLRTARCSESRLRPMACS